MSQHRLVPYPSHLSVTLDSVCVIVFYLHHSPMPNGTCAANVGWCDAPYRTHQCPVGQPQQYAQWTLQNSGSVLTLPSTSTSPSPKPPPFPSLFLVVPELNLWSHLVTYFVNCSCDSQEWRQHIDSLLPYGNVSVFGGCSLTKTLTFLCLNLSMYNFSFTVPYLSSSNGCREWFMTCWSVWSPS